MIPLFRKCKKDGVSFASQDDIKAVRAVLGAREILPHQDFALRQEKYYSKHITLPTTCMNIERPKPHTSFTYLMLSRLLKSARSFLIDTPQIKTTTPLSDTFKEETMVTTRRKQVETPLDDGLSEYNPIHVDVPTSSKKRGRRAKPEDTPEMSAEEDSLPPSTKRRKTLPLREREVESPEGDLEDFKGVKTHPVVEIPARKATPPKGQIGGVILVGSSEKREEQQDVVSKKTHKRFGSEDLDEEFFSTARGSNEGDLVDAPIVLSDEESEESDNDAPEAIGIQEAAQTIKSKDRDAAKVVKEQVDPFSSLLPFLYTDFSQGN
jgi:U3 small nucleolar RNA-associated protein 16